MAYHLLCRDYINEEYGYDCTYFCGPRQECESHDHEFFEFVITLDNNSIHECNNVKTRLKKNSLMLIRPCDVHRFADEKQGEFCYVNLAFDSVLFGEVASFLQSPNLSKILLETEQPAVAVLNDKDAESVKNKFQKLLSSESIVEPKVYVRVVLVTLISRYFLNNVVEKDLDFDMPQWFLQLCSEMHKIENFSIGIERMKDISAMSYGYIGQCFKKYMNITPTEYVNKIRIESAANMLLSSNMKVIDICMACGFGCVDYFGKLFKKHYRLSPSEYRKANVKKND
ncbi:MAG: AraC family transcriptional regulator [Clostridia bacterium]|nr:AraC family transcriptional regulator [Clostridia bacterium]